MDYNVEDAIGIRCSTKKEWMILRKKIQTDPTGIMSNNWDRMLQIATGSSVIIFLTEDEKENGWNNDNGWSERQGYIIISVKDFLNPTVKSDPKPKHKGTLGINFNNIVAKLSPKQTLKHKEQEDDMSETLWKPIETAPENTYILLRGDSGMLTYPKFYVVGILKLDYRDDWIDVHNDHLMDSGYVPEEWMEIPE